MITEAQIFLTRDCNIRCGYCKLHERSYGKELTIEGWIEAWLRLENIGIKTVKIMGGEPTIKPWLPDLIETVNSITTIKTAILSNSTFDKPTLKRIIKAKPYGYFTSVDYIAKGETAEHKKANSGLNTLRKLKGKGIPVLCANVVISKSNIGTALETIKSLSDEGFYVNICIVQHANGDIREFSRQIAENKNEQFTMFDLPTIRKLAKDLIALKRDGYKIINHDIYFYQMQKYAINCSWKCAKPSQVRIDSDGSLMLCNEYRTWLSGKYNILEIDMSSYLEFLRDWYIAREKVSCSGCYWSCFIQAEENILLDIPEFDYANKA